MFEALIIVLAVAVDQVVKWWAEAALTESVISVIPGIIDLRYTQNTGIAFSLFEEIPFVLAILAAVLSAVLILFLYKNRNNQGRLFGFSLALIAGGAIGNLTDRIFRGYVVDMIEPVFVNFAIFNVADCFICVGAVILCCHILFDKQIKI